MFMSSLFPIMLVEMYRPPSALATVKHIKQAQERVVMSSAAPSTDCEEGI